MATFLKRENRVTAQVRYKGVSIGQTFSLKTPAAKWEGTWPDKDLVPLHLHRKWFPDDIAAAEAAEAAVKAASDPTTPHPAWTLEMALCHFRDTVKDSTQDINRLNWWRRQTLGGRQLTEITLEGLTAKDLQGHIKARKTQVASNTIRNEIFLLSSLYSHARAPDSEEDGVHGWGLTTLVNPVDGCALPKPPKPRKRRLQDGYGGDAGEEQKIRDAISAGPDPEEMMAAFDIALETGMRLSEVLGIRCGWLSSTEGVQSILIPDDETKNGDAREVVLSSRAQKAVARLFHEGRRRDPEDTLISLNLPQLEYRWQLARDAAGVKSLRWHDLRHEATSRLAQVLNIGELGNQTGHRNTKVLLSYINVKKGDIARKIG